MMWTKYLYQQMPLLEIPNFETNNTIIGQHVPSSLVFFADLHSLKLTAKASENGWLEY